MRAPIYLLAWMCSGCVTTGDDPACAGDDCAAATSELGGRRSAVSLAVIGDTPYGDAQLAQVGSLIDAIDRDPAVRTVVHVGDIKSGSSPCSDDYFATISELFAGFSDPLVYTPGDNEWTDCHRTRAGKYDPLERLAAVRDTFFPEPGVTLGKPRLVATQSWFPWWREMVENVLWIDARVVFATIHAVGSNNNLQPWFADDPNDTLVDDPARRQAEYERRDAANRAWLTQAFATARLTRAPGVVIFMQADMWDATSVANNQPLDGFDRLIRRIAELAAEYGKPVLLVQGDSHKYLVDQPLAQVPNLTRIVVHGETLPFEYLRLTVDIADPAVFSWQRVPLAP